MEGSLRADELGVAAVDSRTASRHGQMMALDLATAPVCQGISVISELASGIATTVHLAAMAAGGRSVDVLANGIDRTWG